MRIYRQEIDFINIHGSILEDFDETRDIDIGIGFNDLIMNVNLNNEFEFEQNVKSQVSKMNFNVQINNSIDLFVSYISNIYNNLIKQVPTTIRFLSGSFYIYDNNGTWSKITSLVQKNLNQLDYSNKHSLFYLEARKFFDNSFVNLGLYYKTFIYHPTVTAIQSLLMYYGFIPERPKNLMAQLSKVKSINDDNIIQKIIPLWEEFYKKHKELENPEIYMDKISFTEYENKYYIAQQIFEIIDFKLSETNNDV